MSDRLTQLQICLDQLVEQFNATVNYVNTNAPLALLDDDPKSVANIAADATVAGHDEETQHKTGEPSEEFINTINELSTDIILKSRQIGMLVDSLPGIGVLPEVQLKMIQELSDELGEVEVERLAKIAEKDELLKACEDMIVEVAGGMLNTRV